MNNESVAKINNVLAALIITISFIVVGISGSYAYFVNGVKDGGGNKNVTVTSGNLVMTFTTTTGKYINISNSGLINESEVISKGTNNYTEFSITLNNDANNIDKASYRIYLTELKLTNNFKSTDVRWALVDVTSSVPSSIGTMTGNFNGITWSGTAPSGTTQGTANDLALTSGTINKNTTKKYRLYVWLNNNPSANQTGLLNGSLSAKVGFTATSTTS